MLCKHKSHLEIYGCSLCHSAATRPFGLPHAEEARLTNNRSATEQRRHFSHCQSAEFAIGTHSGVGYNCADGGRQYFVVGVVPSNRRPRSVHNTQMLAIQTFTLARTLVPSNAVRVARTLSTASTPSGVRALITGANGQLGVELARLLRRQNGADSVVCTDLRMPSKDVRANGPFYYADACDYERLASLVVDHNVNTVIHFAAILSAAGERNPDLAMKVNIDGTHVAFQLAKNFNLRIFAPSTIGAFGSTTPRDQTPDLTIQRPSTFYGVSKVYLELLGEWYASKYGVDFRCLRYPGIISADVAPGGGTTDYAVDIYIEAIKHRMYQCYLRGDTALPMMYIPDCLEATAAFVQAPRSLLKQSVYNLAAISFTPEQIAASIAKRIPEFKITYKVDEAVRQKIADSWPRSLDDSNARKDWGWQHKFDLQKMTDDMLERIKVHVASGKY
eukprot:TRINITY_DN80_c0_g1_i1.p1 TRINITY_DN80_c0_g1~~TRINITY_DN80_c0_g1_i1.p1  ORF type:complete len:446 (+),score=78.60 TRINITY_DN80_c0_g1_i1:184-1521(+)